MIIDFHTHAFPDAVAAKAIPLLSEKANIKAEYDGTVAGIIENMDKNGVNISVVNSIATNERQMQSVNNFAISLLDNSRLIPFGSVFPSSDLAKQEILRLHEAGVRGIKLHPEYQQFYVDDKSVYPIYGLCAELGMIVTLHCGGDVGYMPPYHSTPRSIKKMLDDNKDTTFVLAHFGSYGMWEEVSEHICSSSNAYIDTSMSNTVGKISVSVAERIIKLHGVEKILFGTDLPWENPRITKEFIESLSLDDSEKNMIFYDNAKRLLNLDF